MGEWVEVAERVGSFGSRMTMFITQYYTAVSFDYSNVLYKL